VERQKHENKEQTVHIEERKNMAVLAAARAAIGESRGHANELPDPERERRVEIYAAQVAQHGRIYWLPASPVRDEYMCRRTRFDDGDALGRLGKTAEPRRRVAPHRRVG